MNALDFIRDFMHNIHLVISNEDARKNRKILFSELRLKLRYLVLIKTLKIKIPYENIIGYRVKYFIYPNLISLFTETFIGNEYFFKTDKDQPLIIDCGSNIGMSVLYFKNIYPDARIIAFEPDRETFKLLKENIGTNKLEGIDVFNKAVCGRMGEVDFYYNPDVPGALGMSIKKRASLKGFCKVDAVVLSSYIKEEVDFLKMDIEGAEDEVMEELTRIGKFKLIKESVIEYHYENGDNRSLAKFLGMLEENGFRYWLFAPNVKPFNVDKTQEVLIHAYRK